MQSETYNSEYEQACYKAICQISEAVNASSAQMYEWNLSTAMASVVAEYHSPQATLSESLDELGVTYDLSEFPSALRCLREKQVHVVYAGSDEADMADRARLAALNSKSLLRVPLAAYDAVMGFIELRESRYARVWTGDEIHLCRTLADHAAMTIENARLRRDQRKQMMLLTLLRDISWQIAQASNLDQVIQIIVNAVATALDCSVVNIVLLDETGRDLVLWRAAETGALSLPPDYCQSIEQGIVGYVARTGRTYMSNNVRRDPLYLSLEGWPRGSEVAVPLQSHDKTIGVLNVESRWLGAFSSADVIAMEILARLIAAALENADRYAQTHQRLNELELLHEIALASARAGDIDALLSQTTQIIAANLYSDNFGFLLVDQAAGLLRLHPSYHGLPPQALQMTIPLGQGVTGQVAASGKPMLVTDVRAEPRYIQIISSTRSEMAAPLFLGGRVFGVLNVESRQVAAYSEDDLRLLVTITDQLSSAIENVQAQERAARAAARWAIINRIGQLAAASLDAAQVLHEAAVALHQQFEYDYVLTARVDKAAGVILPLGYAGGRLPRQFSRAIELDYACGLMGYAAIDGQSICAADVSRDPRYVVVMPDVRSELCVPIQGADGNVIGLVDLRSRRLAAFDADDVQAIETLAGHLAVALTNAQLHAEAQQRLAELTALHELSQTFRLVAEPAQLYEQITRLAARLLSVEQCGIVLYDPVSQMMVMQQPAYGLRSEQVARYRWPLALDPPPAWRRGETLILNDLKNAPPSSEFNPELAIELGERNLMLVPLMLSERCLGFVRLANKARRAPFTASDARLMGVLANQAAIAIENARMLTASQRRIERLTALQHIGKTLVSSRDLPALVESLYRELAAHFNAETFSVYILDPQSQRLEYNWVDCGVYHSAEIDLDSESLGAYVIRSGQPLLIDDLAKRQSELPVKGIPTGAPARAWLGVPLLINSQVVGAITLQSYTPDRFGQEELKLLEQLALQIGLAVQNIRFYRQAQRHITELTILQRVGRQLAALRDPSEIMYAVLEGARSLINPTDARIFLYDAARDRLTLGAARSYYRRRRGFDLPPRPDGLTMRVAHSGTLMAISDAARHPLYAEAGEVGAPGAIIGIPIKNANQTIAVLNVAFANQPHPFTDDEVLVLTMLADQAALALDNAALFEAGRRQQSLAEALYEMAAIINTAPALDDVLHQLLNQIRRVVEYDQASVGVVEGDRFTVRAMVGFPEAARLKLEFLINDLPLAQQIIATAQPVSLADMQDPSAYPHDIMNSIGARKVRATLGVPVVTQGRVIGIIYLDSFKPDAFASEHVQQVRAFADYVALAIVSGLPKRVVDGGNGG